MCAELTSLLNELCRARRPGPKPTFSELHVLKALEVIASGGPVGRIALTRELGLGGGATRTLLARLVRAGLVKSSRAGCELTEDGRALWDRIRARLVKKLVLRRTSLSPGEHNVAVLVRGAADKVRQGMEQRDEAVKAGALGAVTIISRGGRLTIPGVSDDVGADYPDAYRELVEAFRPSEGDVIVICWADDLLRAEYGALAAVLSLL